MYTPSYILSNKKSTILTSLKYKMLLSLSHDKRVNLYFRDLKYPISTLCKSLHPIIRFIRSHKRFINHTNRFSLTLITKLSNLFCIHYFYPVLSSKYYYYYQIIIVLLSYYYFLPARAKGLHSHIKVQINHKSA